MEKSAFNKAKCCETLFLIHIHQTDIFAAHTRGFRNRNEKQRKRKNFIKDCLTLGRQGNFYNAQRFPKTLRYRISSPPTSYYCYYYFLVFQFVYLSPYLHPVAVLEIV